MAKLLVFGLAQIQCPDDPSGVHVRLVINPLFMRTGQPRIADKDHVLAWVLLQQLLFNVFLLHDLRVRSLSLICCPMHRDRLCF
jgi:hypothetical protein